MRTPSHNTDAGNDTPITQPEEDRYGFNSLAKQLARSIIRLDRNISTVIGIEGKWGAGKTSLLNLLKKEMESDRPAGTHVLPVSPWLMPSGDGAVEALLLPVAAILDEEEAKSYSRWRKLWRKCRKAKASPLAESMVRYAQQASGQLAPLAEFTGQWVPGAGIAASVLKTVSTADLSARRQTTAELRADIEKKMARLGLNFIVVLDDLDRLEPDQAVEVLRLIRSVADFAGFHYVMCYDPAVLGHAVEQKLNVGDGRLYLQKIVPLSFSLPRPESFDLRREFLSGTVALYTQVNGDAPDYALMRDLKRITGTFGALLSTPREVKLTLGSLAFRYEGLREYVWFPDLCLLQLLRVTLPELYNWTEYYLTEHAAHVSRDGYVPDKEKQKITEDFKALLDELPSVAALSAMSMADILPGIGATDDVTFTLFSKEAEVQVAERDTDKRLSSSLYWRYYFAFTAPKDVLPPAFFDQLFSVADSADDGTALTTLLFDQMDDNGFSSRTWFEHILDRLTATLLTRASAGACRGLLRFVFCHGDEITRQYRERWGLLFADNLDLNLLAARLLRRLDDDSRPDALMYLKTSLTEKRSFHQAMSYLRYQNMQSSLDTHYSPVKPEWLLNVQELQELRDTASAWLNNPDNRETLLALEDLSGLFYGWSEISSVETVASWVASVTVEDEDFLQVLLRLRYEGYRTDIGNYWGLRMNVVYIFFGGQDVMSARLDKIEAEDRFPEQIREIRKAAALGR